MQIRNFNQLIPVDNCIVVAYFFVTIVSNFTWNSHELFVLADKRMHDTVLLFLGADKWPEMKEKKVVLN